MIVRLALIVTPILLAGCGVKSQRAPEDHSEFVAVSQQLNSEERSAFGTWWNDRSYKIKAGTATDDDFNLTVGEAIKRVDGINAKRDERLAAERACTDRMFSSANGSSSEVVGC